LNGSEEGAIIETRRSTGQATAVGGGFHGIAVSSTFGARRVESMRQAVRTRKGTKS